MLSVVGGRRTSALAIKKNSVLFTKTMVEAGYVIVSGCAKGIDTYSHQAAISHGGRTIAVIGTGIRASLSC